MKSSNKYIINIIATGVFVLFLISILLFWGRTICQINLHALTLFFSKEGFTEPEIVPQDLRARQEASYRTHNLASTKNIGIAPSGLFPEIDKDPNTVRKSYVTAHINNDLGSEVLVGVKYPIDMAISETGKFCISSHYVDGSASQNRLVYFDEKAGLFVYCDVFVENVAGKKSLWVRKALLYAGPEGISKTADGNLGRFSKPIEGLWTDYPKTVVFFDKEKSRFFRINFKENKIISGLELSKDNQPLQIWGSKNTGLIDVSFVRPLKKPTAKEKADRRKEMEEKIKQGKYSGYTDEEIDEKIDEKLNALTEISKFGLFSRKNITILEKTGDIRILNAETLELSKILGRLPGAPPFSGFFRPDDLLAYNIMPISDCNNEDEYLGLITAGVSREGFGFAVSVFDKNGKQVKGEASQLDPGNAPDGSLLMVFKYILESLHPSILNLASYFTSERFEATSGYNSLFILPNSYVAMFGRDSGNIIARFFAALVMISPSILLGVVLGFRVRKDAKAVGLSKRAQKLWLVGTICFGLSAYITYRLTRPNITMVTCVNCGKLRRPDMDNCQSCGSKWDVPELTAPTWRVID